MAVRILGTCADFCPSSERALRNALEFEDDALSYPLIKSFSRSAAGMSQTLEADVRPLPVLSRVVAHLLGAVLARFGMRASSFICDRLRAVRVDGFVQSLRGAEWGFVLLASARFFSVDSARAKNAHDRAAALTRTAETLDDARVSLHAAACDDSRALAAALEVDALRLACAPDMAPLLLRESLPLLVLARGRTSTAACADSDAAREIADLLDFFTDVTRVAAAWRAGRATIFLVRWKALTAPPRGACRAAARGRALARAVFLHYIAQARRAALASLCAAVRNGMPVATFAHLLGWRADEDGVAQAAAWAAERGIAVADARIALVSSAAEGDTTIDAAAALDTDFGIPSDDPDGGGRVIMEWLLD